MSAVRALRSKHSASAQHHCFSIPAQHGPGPTTPSVPAARSPSISGDSGVPTPPPSSGESGIPTPTSSPTEVVEGNTATPPASRPAQALTIDLMVCPGCQTFSRVGGATTCSSCQGPLHAIAFRDGVVREPCAKKPKLVLEEGQGNGLGSEDTQDSQTLPPALPASADDTPGSQQNVQTTTLPAPSQNLQTTLPAPSQNLQTTLPAPTQNMQTTLPAPTQNMQTTLPAPNSQKAQTILPAATNSQNVQTTTPAPTQNPQTLAIDLAAQTPEQIAATMQQLQARLQQLQQGKESQEASAKAPAAAAAVPIRQQRQQFPSAPARPRPGHLLQLQTPEPRRHPPRSTHLLMLLNGRALSASVRRMWLQPS